MTGPALLPAATRVAVPWKDGGGITRGIATGPEGAGLADFDWRLSMAEVAAAGPFSRFAGIDRTLAVLDGTLLLDIAGDAGRLTADSAPVAFAGDVAVTGTPVGGAVINLNLMVRRGTASARLTRLTPDFTPDPAATLILFFTAGGRVHHDDTPIAVARFDALRVDPAAWPALRIETDGWVFAAEIMVALRA